MRHSETSPLRCDMAHTSLSPCGRGWGADGLQKMPRPASGTVEGSDHHPPTSRFRVIDSSPSIVAVSSSPLSSLRLICTNWASVSDTSCGIGILPGTIYWPLNDPIIHCISSAGPHLCRRNFPIDPSTNSLLQSRNHDENLPHAQRRAPFIKAQTKRYFKS